MKKNCLVSAYFVYHIVNAFSGAIVNKKVLSFALLASFFSPTLYAATRYESVVKRMEAVAAQHPTRAVMFELGENDRGEIIKGLRLGSRDAIGLPQMLVVSAHHGDEVHSVDVSMQFIDDFLQPDADPRLNDAVVYVVPVFNINGYNNNRREESYRHGGTLDSNRDYGDPCRKDPPYRLKSTKLLSDFVADKQIVSSVSVHGYIGTFTYPWGTYTTEAMTADHDEFKYLAQQAVAQNGYRFGTHSELIYPTVGAFDDWAYYAHGVWTALLEIKRRPDVAKDARAITEFLALSPRTRSVDHQHLGECRTPARVRARP